MRALILPAIFLSLLVACDRPPSTANSDLDALQGTWTLSYFERDGTETKLESVTQAINTGNNFVVKRGSQVVAAGTVILIPGTSPKASDTTYSKGQDAGKTFKGIYQIDGDTMKFCRAGTPEGERPTEFKSKPNSGQFFAIYKRAPK